MFLPFIFQSVFLLLFNSFFPLFVFLIQPIHLLFYFARSFTSAFFLNFFVPSFHSFIHFPLFNTSIIFPFNIFLLFFTLLFFLYFPFLSCVPLLYSVSVIPCPTPAKCTDVCLELESATVHPCVLIMPARLPGWFECWWGHDTARSSEPPTLLCSAVHRQPSCLRALSLAAISWSIPHKLSKASSGYRRYKNTPVRAAILFLLYGTSVSVLPASLNYMTSQ